MTKKTTARTLLLAAVAAFGLAASSSAQSTDASASSTGSGAGKGLLGQSYVGLDYGYTDMHETSVFVQGLNFEYNQPLRKGFDLNLGLGEAWSSKFSDTRARQQDISASAVAFLPDLAWGRPFIGAGAGWMWTKAFDVKENSFAYGLDAGVEFQVTKGLSITPVVSYTEATSVHLDDKWSFGVKAHYWINNQWGLSAGIARDNMVDTTYSVGTTFRF